MAEMRPRVGSRAIDGTPATSGGGEVLPLLARDPRVLAVRESVSRFRVPHLPDVLGFSVNPLMQAARSRWATGYYAERVQAGADAALDAQLLSVSGPERYDEAIQHLHFAGDVDLRKATVRALIRDLDDDDLETQLLGALRSEPDPRVRCALLDGMARCSSNRSTWVLAAAHYFDSDPSVQYHAAVKSTRHDRGLLKRTRELWARGVDPGTNFESCLQSAKGQDRLPWLELKLNNEPLRYGGLPSPERRVALGTAIVSAETPARRAQAIAQLGRWVGYTDDPVPLRLLLGIHESLETPEEQSAAIHAFTRSGELSVLGVLATWTEASTASVRREALRGIGHIIGFHRAEDNATLASELSHGWHRAMRAVQLRLHSDVDFVVRRTAAHALGCMQFDAGLGDLARVLYDDGEVADAAAEALSMIGTPMALAWLGWGTQAPATHPLHGIPQAWLQRVLMHGMYPAERQSGIS